MADLVALLVKRNTESFAMEKSIAHCFLPFAQVFLMFLQKGICNHIKILPSV